MKNEKKFQKPIMVNIKMPPDIWRDVRVRAIYEERPTHQVVAAAIKEYLAAKNGETR